MEKKVRNLQRGKRIWGKGGSMNKIGWCDMTFNPVIGCKNNCSYCYARRINQRFKFIKDWNESEWREDSFNKKFPKKPQRIFVGSMSEIYYWDKVWIQKIIDKIKQYPQHTFQFLTKFPEVYTDWVFPQNCWLGTTITTNIDAEYISNFSGIGIIKGNIYFYSIEPILCQISPKYLEDINWVIIGAETGNRKGKVIPNLEWVANIINYCRKNNIPVYVKDSIKGWYPYKYKQFPKGVQR